VYTNGTLVDPELLTDDHAGHCVALRESTTEGGDGATFGLCVLDSSTSEFNLAAFEDDICRTRLETMIRQLRVKEMIYTKVKLAFKHRASEEPHYVSRPEHINCGHYAST
jgi:DNA mismatch repair protein MSH6